MLCAVMLLGVLASCTTIEGDNSGMVIDVYMTTELFDKVLAEAAADAHKDFQMIARTRQGADHPVALAFPEGLYLKGVILRSMS